MMREVLFRGKRVDNDEWVYGIPVKSQDGLEMVESLYHVDGAEWNVNGFQVTPESVGQFTGLLDKNGVNIFEGDLLHRHMNVYWKVEFKNSKWIANGIKDYGLYLSYNQFIDTEIIGNIHDNPELL